MYDFESPIIVENGNSFLNFILNSRMWYTFKYELMK